MPRSTRQKEGGPAADSRIANRINWSLLSVVCLGVGLLAAIGLGVFVVRAASSEPLEQVLEMAQPVDLRTPTVTDSQRLQTATRSLLPYPTPSAEVSPVSEAVVGEPPIVDSTLVDVRVGDVRSDGLAPVQAAPMAAPSATNLAASGALAQTSSETSDITTLPSALAQGSTNEQSTTLEPEPPPAAALGFTYCGMVTCNVGFKCCCSVCVPGDQECEPSACEAYAGLSVSVACGMDLCDSGEICCDPRCGACARAGECPEEPCG